MHARGALYELGKNAFVVGGQVLHQHKGHARIAFLWHSREKRFKCCQPASRRADAYDGKGDLRCDLRFDFGPGWFGTRFFFIVFGHAELKV